MTLPPKEKPACLRERRHCYRALLFGGFSLVEVVLALGLASFALVAIMGLLAIGLDRSRDNRIRVAEGQILEWMQGQAKKAYEGDVLSTIVDGNPYLFDYEGGVLTGGNEETFFSAIAEPGERSLPGSRQKVLGVKVTIIAQGGQTLGNYAFWFTK